MRLEYKPVRDFMSVLDTCKFDNDPISKLKGSNFEENSWIGPEIKLVQDFMPGLVPAILKKTRSKMKALYIYIMSTTFSPLCLWELLVAMESTVFI